MAAETTHDKTKVGNYFIANYPPFSCWRADALPAITDRFRQPPTNDVPLGLYLHIPFCRKRCKFCYFKVYTDVNAGAIQEYVDALAEEIALAAQQPAIAGRKVAYAYFGGGTPSFLSARQLDDLVGKLRRSIGWDQAEEVTFECEPGTLSEPKLSAIKQIGVSRLSLGIENFDDAVLAENGRAHLSAEIYRAWDWIQKTGFREVNIDLIAGMVGDHGDNWKENIRKTIELEPDSVTIYQMELPFNTRYSKDLLVLHEPLDVASWSTKRAWLDYAFDTLLEAGYAISSAYTLVKGPARFCYRDSLWHGSDLLAGGVASFGHLQGIHYQNIDKLERYLPMISAGELPLGRAYETTAIDRLIRELVLQLKLGRLDAGYFRDKFAVDILDRFADVFGPWCEDGLAKVEGGSVQLTRKGLLRVDSLLPQFFLPEHRTDRYT